MKQSMQRHFISKCFKAITYHYEHMVMFQSMASSRSITLASQMKPTHLAEFTVLILPSILWMPMCKMKPQPWNIANHFLFSHVSLTNLFACCSRNGNLLPHHQIFCVEIEDMNLASSSPLEFAVFRQGP